MSDLRHDTKASLSSDIVERSIIERTMQLQTRYTVLFTKVRLHLQSAMEFIFVLLTELPSRLIEIFGIVPKLFPSIATKQIRAKPWTNRTRLFGGSSINGSCIVDNRKFLARKLQLRKNLTAAASHRQIERLRAEPFCIEFQAAYHHP